MSLGRLSRVSLHQSPRLPFLCLSWLLFLFLSLSSAAVPSQSPAKHPVKLNVDVLPPLTDVLAELQLDQFLPQFVKISVTETRLLLKLSQMDFQMMLWDWEGIRLEDITALKRKIAQLIELATVHDNPQEQFLQQRKKLTYGRVYLSYSGQSFDFITGTFGGSVPIGYQRYTLSSSLYECPVTTGADGERSETTSNDSSDVVDYQQQIVLVRRGHCTFLQKALSAQARNAAGMIIIDSEDQLYSPASGVGIDANITEQMIKPLASFPVISVANTSFAALVYGLQHKQLSQENNRLAIVPLRCQLAGKCLPVMREEEAWQVEITWGVLQVDV